MTDATGDGRPRLSGRDMLYVAAICLGVSLWATNSIISVTVLPSAVIEIGGLPLLSWATTAYVTASIVFSAADGWTKERQGGSAGLVLGEVIFPAGALRMESCREGVWPHELRPVAGL